MPKGERVDGDRTSESSLIKHVSTLQSLVDGKDNKRKSKIRKGKRQRGISLGSIADEEADKKPLDLEELKKRALGRLSPLGRGGYRNGDLFGTRGDYVDGLIYQSRGGGTNAEAMTAIRQGSRGFAKLAALSPKSRSSKARGQTRDQPNLGNLKGGGDAKRIPSKEDDTDFISVCWKTVFRAKLKAQKSDLHSLQEAAGALRNIVDNPELHPLLIKNGIISGIKALLERTRDSEVVRSCSDALCTLAHNTKIQGALVDEGLIEMLIYFMRGSAHLKTLAPRNANKDMICNCALSILALSANAASLQGQLQVSLPLESRLVREGPLSELQKLQNRDTLIRWAMLKTIFNVAALGTHLPCLWLEDVIRLAIDSIQHSIHLATKEQLHIRRNSLDKSSGEVELDDKSAISGEDSRVGNSDSAGSYEGEFYALILLLQTLCRLSRISGVSQTLLTRDITHHISAVVALSYDCIMKSADATAGARRVDSQKHQAVELLELSCVLLYYLSQSVKVAPRMMEAQVPALLRDIWAKLLNLRQCSSSAKLKMAEVSLELTTITVAVLGNLARNAFARTSLIESGLTAELALLAQEHTQHLKMRTSGVSNIRNSASDSSNSSTIDPILSEKLLSTAVATLQEIASDNVSAGTIAKQGALRMLNVVATFASELSLRAKAIVTICNILSSGDVDHLLSQIQEDMQDALDVLVMLHREILLEFNIKKSGFIATALHNLSCKSAGRQMMKRVGDSVVETAIWVAQQQAPLCTASHSSNPISVVSNSNNHQAERADTVVALCAGLLFNLSTDPQTSSMLMQRKWIRGVIELMKQSKMSRVDELCIATLHNLSHGYDKAGRVYAGEGALEELIDLAKNPLEPSAQGLAMKTLCILTTEPENVPPMVRRGLIGALVQASHLQDLAECATVGLNNLAEYGNGQLVGKLIEEGAVDILIDHIANKDSTIRGYSVLAVCHLACTCSTGIVLDSEKSNHCLSMMRRHGAIESLLLAGFVRSSEDSKEIQQACCKGLYALLASAAKGGEIEQVTTWQVVRAAVSMLELGNEIRNYATIILVNISCLDEGRELFTGMGFDALNDVALGRVSPPPTLEIRKRIVKILHNMLFLSDPTSISRSEDHSSDEDEIMDFQSDSKMNEKETMHTEFAGTSEDRDEDFGDLSSFFARNQDESASPKNDPNSLENLKRREHELKALATRCKRIVMANGVPTLMSLCRIEDPDCRLMCAVALSTIANNPSTHARFVSDGGFRAMTEMAHYDRTDVGTSACWSIRMCCVRTAAYASRQPESRLRCVVDGVCEMIVQAVQSTTFAEETKHLCCQTIELFSRGEKARPFMAQQGIVEALDHLLGVASSKNKEAEAVLFARTIRNLSFSDAQTEDILVEFGVVHLFHSFAPMPIESVAVDCAVALCNVFQKSSHDNALTLIHDHALKVIQSILAHGGKDPFSHHAEEIREACAACLLSMAIQEESREFLVREGIFKTIHSICTQGNPTDQTIDACCRALCVFCLDPTIRPLIVRKKAHTNVVGLHSIFARRVSMRNGVRGILHISQSRLALALLNLARVGKTDTQSDIINHCDASALLEQASALSDKERDDINEPVLIDIDRRDKVSNLVNMFESQQGKDTEFEHSLKIPEVYSFTRAEAWPTVSFRTNPVRISGLDSRDTLDLAPRWKDLERPTGLEALKQAVNKGQQSQKHREVGNPDNSNVNEDKNSGKSSGSIIVNSSIMHRLNSRLNNSYKSNVTNLRYANMTESLDDTLIMTSEGSSTTLSTTSSMVSSGIFSNVHINDREEGLQSGPIADHVPEIITSGRVVTDDLLDSLATMHEQTSDSNLLLAKVVPKIKNLLEGSEPHSLPDRTGETLAKTETQRKPAGTSTQSMEEAIQTMDEKLPSIAINLSNPTSKNSIHENVKNKRRNTQKRVVITNGRLSVSERQTQNDAKMFLLAMRSRSTAEVKHRNRALASELCETLQLLKAADGTDKLKRFNPMMAEQSIESTLLSPTHQHKKRSKDHFPAVASELPSSPKLSRITFSR